MIDLVLQNACIPAACLSLECLAEAIQRVQTDAPAPRDDRPIPIDAEATLEVLGELVAIFDQRRVDEHVRLDRYAFLLAQQLRRDACLQLQRISDDRDPESGSDLWRGKSDADAIECGDHHVNQLLDFGRCDRFACDMLRRAMQYRRAGLFDAQARLPIAYGHVEIVTRLRFEASAGVHLIRA